MLELNEEKNKYEGETKLSDCEAHFRVLWLKQSGQASLYIGDKYEQQDDFLNFLSGEKECFINVKAYRNYLSSIKEIVKKYSSMYYGDVSEIDIVNDYFSNYNRSEAKIIISYTRRDRYVRILNNKKEFEKNKDIYGEEPLINGNMFRNGMIGAITKISLWKDSDKYRISIELIDEWRDKIMQENGKKVDIESLAEILNNEIDSNLSKGLSIEDSARIFGIKYAPLLKANESKFGYEEIVAASNYKEDIIKEAIKSGIDMSPIVIWQEANNKKEKELQQGEQTDVNINTIVYGAPGTGKTYSMPEYAVAILEKQSVDYIKELYKDDRDGLLEKYNDYIDSERAVFTTFHQSYGYEDFIEGLRPNVDSKELKFEVVDGIFKKLADKALEDRENNYVIIIDEINRGNISKIFGELITLIESDKRWGEDEQMRAKLASGKEFKVPNNLFIIGTMNSADKSIALIDTALRRRFMFIEKSPDGTTISDDRLKQIFNKLNKSLYDELKSSDLLIGHSFFVGRNYNQLEDIFNNNIIPLLYEYYFGDEKSIKDVINSSLEGFNDFEIDDEDDGIHRLRIKKK